MASFALLKTITRQGCRVVSQQNIINRAIQPRCLISTSKKNKDAAAISEPVQSGTNEKLGDKEENWISYGYNLVDRDMDSWSNSMVMFSTIVIGLIGASFLITYFPDHRLQDWSQREAFLELARREKEGLPLVDKNFLDPDKIILPSDEELGDTEIII